MWNLYNGIPVYYVYKIFLKFDQKLETEKFHEIITWYYVYRRHL